ncbi:portal (connector) protein [Enterococcus phage vB_Efm_LG62]|uniref:Portal (Connector) protein n=1 Tax=Enterococcus phage vB_Efm_LG62 TaxID=2970334 RepID=A0A976SG81_9CAUD|nr:portal (connector) protein [Enterococcus phage vB_Efm_LG62]
MGLFINNGNAVTEKQIIDYINTGTAYTTNFTGLKALTNSDIYTGVNIIAGDIAQSPFKPAATTSVDDSLLYLLNKEPKENQSHYTMMYAVVSNLVLTGNAYVLIHRNNDDSVKELEFVETQQVNVIRDLVTGLYRYEVNMPYGNIMYKCDPRDILHFKLSTTDGWLGRSPLLSLNEEISLQTNGLKVLNNFFSKGVFSGGILKLLNGTVNNQTKAKIRDDFEKVNGAGGTIVLDETQEFNENKINTEVLKLIQANKFSTQQIAKVLGIPVNRFGQELVNSSDTGQNDIYIASTIAMYESSICDELNLKLGVELELDLSKLRQDTKEDRLRRIAEGRVKSEFAQALTVNDARGYLGFTEIEGGEALLGQKSETSENKTEQDVNVNEEELGNQSPTDTGEDRG